MHHNTRYPRTWKLIIDLKKTQQVIKQYRVKVYLLACSGASLMKTLWYAQKLQNKRNNVMLLYISNASKNRAGLQFKFLCLWFIEKQDGWVQSNLRRDYYSSSSNILTFHEELDQFAADWASFYTSCLTLMCCLYNIQSNCWLLFSSLLDILLFWSLLLWTI